MANVRERMIPDERGSAFWLRLHVGRYVFAAQFVEGKAVLDIACGNGYGSRYLINKGAKKVVGGDNSEEAIEYARHHYQKDGLHFLRLDAQEMLFRDNSFDVAVSLETIEHLERYEDFLKECRRVLKDDGIFICSTPNRKVTFGSRDPYHFKEFSVEEFYELIARYFAEVKLYGQGFVKRADILKRELIWRSMPLISLIPQSVRSSLLNLVFTERRHTISLAEVDPGLKGAFDDIIEESYTPSLLSQDSPLCRDIIAVVRKQGE